MRRARFVPVFRSKKITYLHLALLNDSPKVVVALVRHGTFLYKGDNDYPDLTPLYLAVANPFCCTTYYDGPLRIASSYALPWFCEYLLVRGATPNKLSKFGVGPMQLAVMRRFPFGNFNEIARFYRRNTMVHRNWQHLLRQTLSILLRFDGDPNLQSANSRRHRCNPQCWRSVDCQHSSQRVLHFAAASGDEDVVSLLLFSGADPTMCDGEGYLPLYSALSQGHYPIASRLMGEYADPANLIIVRPIQSTAFHITCRFASVMGTLYLLKKGADVNAVDSIGKTPLHEVLSQDCTGLEGEIIKTIKFLL